MKFILVTHTSFCDKTKGFYTKEIECKDKNEAYDIKVLENNKHNSMFTVANSSLIPIRYNKTIRKLTFIERLTGKLKDKTSNESNNPLKDNELENIRRMAERGLKMALASLPGTPYVDVFQYILDTIPRVKTR